jgi:hypothetical protein
MIRARGAPRVVRWARNGANSALGQSARRQSEQPALIGRDGHRKQRREPNAGEYDQAEDPLDRLDSFLHELDRTNLADLEVLALPEPDPELRAGLLGRVAAAAAAAGQDAVDVGGTRAGVRELMLRRLSADTYRPTWAGLNWVASPMRTDDRTRLMVAVEDAAIAALLEDCLDPDDVAALRGPFEVASSMAGSGITGVPDLSGGRAIAAPVAAIELTAGAGGLGLIAALAAFLRRRRRRLEDRD